VDLVRTTYISVGLYTAQLLVNISTVGTILARIPRMTH
jgi:hypothetical protein